MQTEWSMLIQAVVSGSSGRLKHAVSQAVRIDCYLTRQLLYELKHGVEKPMDNAAFGSEDPAVCTSIYLSIYLSM